MNRMVATVFACVVMPAAGVACPNPELFGEPIGPFVEEPFGAKRFQTFAGGPHQLSSECPAIVQGMRSDKGDGWFTMQPQYSLTTPDIGDYQMDIYAVSACDTALLIHTAAGNYYYDDNDFTGIYPLLSMTNPRPGVIDIWVGTHYDDRCDAIVTVDIENISPG